MFPNVARRVPALARFLPMLALAATLGSGACATGRSNPFAGTSSRKITIEVLNLYWNQATLHALRGSERFRLGIVQGKNSARYTMDWPMSQSFRLEIDLLAGRKCVTHEILLEPGDELHLQIGENAIIDFGCEASL